MPRTTPRLYLAGNWASGTDFLLSLERSHYLSSVLRARSGSEVRVFNAEAGEWMAKISTIDKRLVTIKIVEQVTPPQLERAQCLIFAPIKKAPLEWLIEKATELGVTCFQPVLTERTQVRVINSARMEAIAIEAAEQCERMSVPIFNPLQSLPKLLSSWPAAESLHVALERHNVSSATPKFTDMKTIMIGPEGGFSDTERALLLTQDYVNPFTLGPRILRAETAAIAALSWTLLLESIH